MVLLEDNGKSCKNEWCLALHGCVHQAAGKSMSPFITSTIKQLPKSPLMNGIHFFAYSDLQQCSHNGEDICTLWILPPFINTETDEETQVTYSKLSEMCKYS